MPHTSSVPLTWRSRRSRYALIGNRCSSCNTTYFPPRAICQKCRRKGKLGETALSGLGEVVSFTIIKSPPKGFESQAPYIIGIIKLDEGPTTAAQIINSDNIDVGKRVKMVFRKNFEDGEGGLLQYGFKFEVI